MSCTLRGAYLFNRMIIMASDLITPMSHSRIAGLRSSMSCSNECFIILVLKPEVDYKKSATN